jgi:hypothetical protein
MFIAVIITYTVKKEEKINNYILIGLNELVITT